MLRLRVPWLFHLYHPIRAVFAVERETYLSCWRAGVIIIRRLFLRLDQSSERSLRERESAIYHNA